MNTDTIDTGHRTGCAFGRTARCTCMYLMQWDKHPEYTAPTFAPRDIQGNPLTTTVTVPEPLGAVLREGLDWGYTINETRNMDADSSIFREVVNAAVAKQIAHEEDQIKVWLAAVIADPAGRKIIEEML